MTEADQSLVMRTHPPENYAFDESIKVDSIIPTYSPALAPSSFIPFRLLDLPQELQDKIYHHLYEEKYDIKVYVRDNEPTKHGPGSSAPKTLVLHGLPSHSLELACRKTRQDTADLRKNAFSGHLYVPYSQLLYDIAVCPLALTQFAWLRARVLEIEFSGFTDDFVTMWDAPASWTCMLVGMTKLRGINVTHTSERRMHTEPQSLHTTPEWNEINQPGYNEMFSAGLKDDFFRDRLIDHHGVLGFACSHENTIPGLALYPTVRVRWLDNGTACTREQGIKVFLHRIIRPQVDIEIVKRWQIDDPPEMIW